MTHAQFLELSVAQKHKLHQVYHRDSTEERKLGVNFIDWLNQCTFAPTRLHNYVGVQWAGMFLGIATDGYCHS